MSEQPKTTGEVIREAEVGRIALKACEQLWLYAKTQRAVHLEDAYALAKDALNRWGGNNAAS